MPRITASGTATTEKNSVFPTAVRNAPFKDFEKHGKKLCYVDHSTGELKEIKDKLKLTKENLGYDTKNGLALRLVHEKTILLN